MKNFESNSSGIEGNPCMVCGVRDPEKPMCFRNTNWCCEDHRKIFQGEVELDSLTAGI